MKKILDVRITRDRKNRTLRINQFYYLSEMLDKLHMLANKHNSIKLLMNDYDFLRSIESHDQRIDQREY